MKAYCKFAVITALALFQMFILIGCSSGSSGSSSSGGGGNSQPPQSIVSVNKYAYITNYLSNSVVLCAINESSFGLENCANTGSNFSVPYGIAIESRNNRVYVADGNGNITTCSLESSTGELGNCTSSTYAWLNQPFGVTISLDGSLIYITNIGNNSIEKCTINESDGSLSDCDSALGGVKSTGVVFNLNGQYAYIANYQGHAVYICSVTESGGFESCVANNDSLYTNPTGLAMDVSGNYLYVSNDTESALAVSCALSLTSWSSFSSCTAQSPVFQHSNGIAVEPTGTHIYIVNNNINTISVCQLSNGSITNCQSNAGNGEFDAPETIALY